MNERLKLPVDTFRAQAVYSDETKQFRSPAEPLYTDPVKISIRVGTGTFTAIFLCTNNREYLMDLEKAGFENYMYVAQAIYDREFKNK